MPPSGLAMWTFVGRGRMPIEEKELLTPQEQSGDEDAPHFRLPPI